MSPAQARASFYQTRFVLALALASALVSCKKSEPAWRQNEFKRYEISKAPDDVKLPEALWEKIESVYKGPKIEGKAAAAEPTEGADTAVDKGSLPTEFAPLKVFLIEKNHGILHGQNHELMFGPGGGEIDLEDFVDAKNGSFAFAAEFMPEVPFALSKSDPDRRVFFLSDSPQRKLGGELFGNGCNTYFDITTAFEKAMVGPGFILNTSEQRHVSALVGTYFFALKHEKKLYLAELTIKDSKRTTLLCRR